MTAKLMKNNETKSNWFAVQVTPGTESAAAETLRETLACAVRHGDTKQGRACASQVECFAPLYRTMRKTAGELRECESALIPGCIVVVSADGQLVRDAVRRSGVAQSARFAVEQMDDALVDWISGCTEPGNRVMNASEGVADGAHVRVTAGPLVAREGWIRRVNQRKKCAYLDIPAGGKDVQAEIGLRVVRA